MFQPVADVLATSLLPASPRGDKEGCDLPDASGSPGLHRHPRASPPWPFRSRAPVDAVGLAPPPPGPARASVKGANPSRLGPTFPAAL